MISSLNCKILHHEIICHNYEIPSHILYILNHEIQGFNCEMPSRNCKILRHEITCHNYEIQSGKYEALNHKILHHNYEIPCRDFKILNHKTLSHEIPGLNFEILSREIICHHYEISIPSPASNFFQTKKTAACHVIEKRMWKCPPFLFLFLFLLSKPFDFYVYDVLRSFHSFFSSVSFFISCCLLPLVFF